MTLESLFVFDLETIPDIETTQNLLNCDNLETNQIRQKLTDYHLEITNGANDFPRQLFHQIVCLSFVTADIEKIAGKEYYQIKEIKTGGKFDTTEFDLISKLSTHLNKEKPRLISFNGRTFDIPVLKYRALKYNISMEWFYKSGDKWNSYTNRYSLDWNCDLLEAFSDFGASARIKLKELCALLCIPCKYNVDGSEVMQMYDEKKIKEIRDYCEIDALTTYIAYLKYALHTGLTSLELYKRSLKELINYLNEQGIEKPHFEEFLNLWKNLHKDGIIL